MSFEPVNPFYYPTYHGVVGITRAFPAQITTAVNHNYVNGTIVRIIIPEPYTVRGNSYNFGMNQINGISSSITITGNATFTMDDVDSTYFDPFNVPAGVGQSAQCLAIGEENNTINAAIRNVL